MVGFALIAQLACTIAANQPAWGYRTLMVGCSLYTCACGAAWRMAWPAARGRSAGQSLVGRDHAAWVGVAGIAAVLLRREGRDRAWRSSLGGNRNRAGMSAAARRLPSGSRQPSWAWLRAGCESLCIAGRLGWASRRLWTRRAGGRCCCRRTRHRFGIGGVLGSDARPALWRSRTSREPLLGLQVCFGVAFNLILFLAAMPVVLFPAERLPEDVGEGGRRVGLGSLAARHRRHGLVRGACAWPLSRRAGGALVLGIGVLLACAMAAGPTMATGRRITRWLQSRASP